MQHAHDRHHGQHRGDLAQDEWRVVVDPRGDEQAEHDCGRHGVPERRQRPLQGCILRNPLLYAAMEQAEQHQESGEAEPVQPCPPRLRLQELRQDLAFLQKAVHDRREADRGPVSGETAPKRRVIAAEQSSARRGQGLVGPRDDVVHRSEARRYLGLHGQHLVLSLPEPTIHVRQ